MYTQTLYVKIIRYQ